MTVYYGSSVSNGTITTACTASTTTGGTETSKTSTWSGGNHFAEVWSQGGSSTPVTAIPGTPTGHGWVTTAPGAGTFATGNWSASIALALSSSSTVSWTVRFFKYSSGTYTSIGTIATSAASLGTSRTVISFTATSMSSVVFAAGDLLYYDLWMQDTTGAGGDNAIVYESNSSSAGVANDVQITTSTFTPSSSTFSRTVPATIALKATLSRTVSATFALANAHSRTVSATFALANTHSRTVPATIALDKPSSRTVPAHIALKGTLSRTVPAHIALTNRVSRTIPATFALSVTSHRTIPSSIALVVEIASGGFGVFASGSNTVTFDQVRFTQVPDPSLSLAPVLPRLGNTTVSWDEVIPDNTSRTVKTSLDGVNWTDVTSSNGGTIPGLNGQPDPIIDYFNSDTSTNYTNTAKSGGSVATVTYDTTNSRVTLSGGSGALYLYTAISDNDVDLIVDMDESDAGGLVWRFVDTNNYYELGAYDDSSSRGFTNQLRLYKVVAGTRSLIGSASTISWPRSTPGTSPYKRIRVTMLGSTITVYFDGTIMQTATDSTFASGKMGLRNDGGTSRYYQLRLQQVGDNVSGTPAGDIVTSQFVYTQITLNTTDPSVNPEIQDVTTSANSPSVASGAVIPQLHDPSKPFAAFYSAEMDSLTQSSGDYYWTVISNALTFAERHATPAPWILHSSDLLFTPSVRPTFSADLYRNRQIITNCLDTVTVTGEQKIADGIATSWQMAYPLYSAPTITVQGITKTVGEQGKSSNKDFYWQAGSTSISQDSSAASITSGYVISVDYVGQFYTTVTRDNLAEQAARKAVEGGTGIVEAIEDGKQMLASAAQTYADGLLARFSKNDTVEIQVTTRRAGLQKGQQLPVFIPEHNINNAQLLITRIVTIGEQLADGTILYQFQATATNGPNLNRWSSALSL